jgi:hypothetical protein
MNNKKRVAVRIICVLAIMGCALTGCAEKEKSAEMDSVKMWTCGMHPSVRVTDAEYKKGTRNCPICNMTLIPVSRTDEEKQDASEEKTEETYYGCGVKEEGHCPHCDEGRPDTGCECGGHSFLLMTDKQMSCPVCKKPLKQMTSPLSSDKEMFSRVKLSPEQIELAGVATEPVVKRRLSRFIRTVGKVAFDPELAVSQEEFLTALRTRLKVKNSTDPDVIKRADDMVAGSKFKLRLLGMNDNEIADLEKENKVQMSLVLPEEKAWVYADIYEYELGWIRSGQDVSVTVTAYPGEKFTGKIKSISPVISPMTRSAKVRIELDNKDKKLQPEMYVDVVMESVYTSSDGSPDILSVPKDAVLDTGIRKMVYVDTGNGVYMGRETELGPEASAYDGGRERKFYPVVNGLEEGDRAVTRSNFLIDSQSQLTGGSGGAYGGALTADHETKTHQHMQH